MEKNARLRYISLFLLVSVFVTANLVKARDSKATTNDDVDILDDGGPGTDFCKNDDVVADVCRACAALPAMMSLPLEMCCSDEDAVTLCNECVSHPKACFLAGTLLQDSVMASVESDLDLDENDPADDISDDSINDMSDDLAEDSFSTDTVVDPPASSFYEMYPEENDEAILIADKTKRFGTLFLGNRPPPFLLSKAVETDVMKRDDNDDDDDDDDNDDEMEADDDSDDVLVNDVDKRWGTLSLGSGLRGSGRYSRLFWTPARQMTSADRNNRKRWGTLGIGKRWGTLGIGNGKRWGTLGIGNGKRWGTLGIGNGKRSETEKRWGTLGIGNGKRWGTLGIGNGKRWGTLGIGGGKRWGTLGIGNGKRTASPDTQKKWGTLGIGKRWGSLGIGDWTWSRFLRQYKSNRDKKWGTLNIGKRFHEAENEPEPAKRWGTLGLSSGWRSALALRGKRWGTLNLGSWRRLGRKRWGTLGIGKRNQEILTALDANANNLNSPDEEETSDDSDKRSERFTDKENFASDDSEGPEEEEEKRWGTLSIGKRWGNLGGFGGFRRVGVFTLLGDQNRPRGGGGRLRKFGKRSVVNVAETYDDTPQKSNVEGLDEKGTGDENADAGNNADAGKKE